MIIPFIPQVKLSIYNLIGTVKNEIVEKYIRLVFNKTGVGVNYI
jgi:hypothetical protein